MRFQAELDEMRAAAERFMGIPPAAPAKVIPMTTPRLPIDPISHAAQAMHVASGDLLDVVRTCDRATCLRLQPILHGLMERIEAVDELMTRRINGEL